MSGIIDGIAPTITPSDTDVPRCRLPKLLRERQLVAEEIATLFTNTVFIIRRTEDL